MCPLENFLLLLALMTTNLGFSPYVCSMTMVTSTNGEIQTVTMNLVEDLTLPHSLQTKASVDCRPCSHVRGPCLPTQGYTGVVRPCERDLMYFTLQITKIVDQDFAVS